MYSADMSSSLTVELRPRFNRTGRPHLPRVFSSAKFCMLRAPICRMSAYSATRSTSQVAHHFGDDAQSGSAPRLIEQLQPFLLQPLEVVRRRPRLERAPSQEFRSGAGMIGANMAGTDSMQFQDLVASVSVRENERVTGVIKGSNPNHHETTDKYENYG